MKLYSIHKGNELICKQRFSSLVTIKKYLREQGLNGKFTIVEYNLKKDHKMYDINVKKN